MAQPVLLGTSCLEHRGPVIAHQDWTGVKVKIIGAFCRGASWEPTVAPDSPAQPSKGHSQGFTAMIHANLHQIAIMIHLMLGVHLTPMMPAGRPLQYVRRASRMCANVCIRGKLLPPEIYAAAENFPNFSAMALYGTSCAAWDQIAGSPTASRCPPGSDFSSPDHNWCQLPWCFVSSQCPSKIPSNVFNGTNLFYSYDVCGNAPNCYHDFSGDPRCPFDPTKSFSFTLHKTEGCECKYHGYELDSNIYMSYPTSFPGKYATLPGIKIYGTSCAAWDQMPATPWSSYCPYGADWCHSNYNFCQLPWCYVGAECSSKIPSMVFEGAADMYYSHDTCFLTPNCREDHLDRNCPYDNRVSGWATSADCKHGWSDVCDCLYQGSNLPELLYENLMDNLSSIALYGTSCAAWDHIPGTPLAHHCLPGSDWSGDKNWCQVPWCYVNSSCPSRMQSRLFGNAFFRYDTCGNAPNCYDDWTHRSCPFDPYGSKSYTLHQHGGCECIFHGRHLPEEFFFKFCTGWAWEVSEFESR